MQRKIRCASLPFAVKALTALAVAAAFSNVGAAGLGKLTVLSALGQPLRAEIDLTSVSRDEADSLAAKLASSHAFKQANIEFNPALMSMRFAVEQKGGRQFIRITSSQPINEPYVGMLIELASNRGRLVREYTFLLDPAELRQTQIAAATPPAAVSGPSASVQAAVPGEKHSVATHERPARKASSGTARAKSAEDKVAEEKGEYRVRRGDTLGLIAGRIKHDGVSLDQMLVSIYRSNPEAFIGNNMNRLKSGKVMTIPDAATAGGIPQAEARSLIVAQSNDFDQYRNKLAGMVAQAPAQLAEQPTQAMGGKITAKVDEQPSAVSKSVDRLKLSKENAGVPESEKVAGVVSTEDKLSQDKSVADAQVRIRELEKNLKELQGILDLRSKDLAAQQKLADAASVVKPAEPAVAQPTAPVPAATPKPAAAAKPKLVTPPPPPPPSLLDELLGNSTVLGGIAAAVLGLGYLIWNSIRRRRQAQELTSKFMAEPVTESPNSLFGSTGGQSVNTNNSVFNSNFTPSAIQLDANEVDPVAEADVYIAYGREAQAIEILRDALRAQPERNAVRIKLLEIYASQNDLSSFDGLASDLYAMTKGEGEDWAYAAKMGASIDPKNPLYTTADMLEEIADKPGALHSFTNPVEALDPDSLMSPSRLTEESGVQQAIGQTAESVAVAADPDADQWADLPLDIGGFDAGAGKKQAVADDSKPAEDMKLEEPLEWKIESRESADMMQDLSFEPAAASDQVVPEPASTADDEAPLDFETLMNFLPAKEEAAEAVHESGEQIVAETNDELLSMDFAEDSADSLEELAVDEQAQLSAAMPAEDAAVPEEIASDASATLMEAPALDISLPELIGEDKSPVAATEQSDDLGPFEFDFASINLDLGTSATDPRESGLAGLSEGVPMVNIEMATKLDLAVAYMEIGDKEGARELLDEVLKGGSDEQVAKAKETLAKLR